jgi:mono/diheme cytochrome c family protein
MRTFAWTAVLGLVLGGAVWAMAQQQAQMGGRGGMMGGGMIGQGGMGGGMMGTGPYSPQQNTGGAASSYSNLCASCHGPTGSGNGPAAGALNPKPTDFTDCKVMTKISDDTLFTAIKGGGRSVGLSPMMPPWGSLADQQIHGLVSYIRGFCGK